jgi:hypothetical protein
MGEESPKLVTIYKIDGWFHWDVEFADRGLNQSGKTAGFDAAMECVWGAVANARTIDDEPD